MLISLSGHKTFLVRNKLGTNNLSILVHTCVRDWKNGGAADSAKRSVAPERSGVLESPTRRVTPKIKKRNYNKLVFRNTEVFLFVYYLV